MHELRECDRSSSGSRGCQLIDALQRDWEPDRIVVLRCRLPRGPAIFLSIRSSRIWSARIGFSEFAPSDNRREGRSAAAQPSVAGIDRARHDGSRRSGHSHRRHRHRQHRSLQMTLVHREGSVGLCLGKRNSADGAASRGAEDPQTVVESDGGRGRAAPRRGKAFVPQNRHTTRHLQRNGVAPP